MIRLNHLQKSGALMTYSNLNSLWLLLLCLLDPQWVSTRPKKGANLVAILADNSRSLQVADANEAGARGDKLRAALAATDIPGTRTVMPWTKVAFGPDGQNTHADPVLLQWIGDKFVTVFPESAAVAPAKWPMNA